MTAVLRADGSTTLGLGHVMRTITLAHALRARGVRSVVATRALDAAVTGYIRDHGLAVEELGADLGVEDDAHATWKVAERYGARLVVSDLCDNDSLTRPHDLRAWHAILARDYYVMAFAGGTLVDLPAALVVSPYVHTRAVRRRGFLGGPRYFVFRSPFLAASRHRRVVRRNASRVLVTLGGSDPARLTAKVLNALAHGARPHLEIHVIVGPRFVPALRDEIRAAMGALGRGVTLLPHDTDMAGAMLWADLAITNDGLTKYETAVTGTPTIVLEVPGSDRVVNTAFAKAGTARFVPDAVAVSASALGEVIADVLDDVEARRAMARAGKRLLDGRGLERVMAAVPAALFSRAAK